MNGIWAQIPYLYYRVKCDKVDSANGNGDPIQDLEEGDLWTG